MHLFPLAWYGLGAVLALMLAVWALSLRLRDASIVDRYWGLGFVLLVWVYALASESRGALATLLVALVSVWGIRLSLHIHLRNRGHGEDYRYARMREQHGARFWWYSLFSVFLLQGLIAAGCVRDRQRRVEPERDHGAVLLPLSLAARRGGDARHHRAVHAGVLPVDSAVSVPHPPARRRHLACRTAARR